jgi:hypothetical protein
MAYIGKISNAFVLSSFVDVVNCLYGLLRRHTGTWPPLVGGKSREASLALS